MRRDSNHIYGKLHVLSSLRFSKLYVSMTRPSFQYVVELIKTHPVFQSKGRKPQRPVEEQLAAFLMRCSGKLAMHTSTDMAIAEGTTYLYCKRVCTAVLDIRDQFLSWPTRQRRARLKAEMEDYGFPGCIGILDGTLIPLAERPKEDGWSFFCRKKFYALAVQAVCDHKSRFTSYDMGWPGSVNDSKIFRYSDIYLQRDKHFEWDEYILCDKGAFSINQTKNHLLTICRLSSHSVHNTTVRRIRSHK